MMQRFVLILTLFAFIGAASGCGGETKSNTSSAPSTSSPMKVTGQPTATPSGLQYWDIVVGTGPTAAPGNMVKVHYSGFSYIRREKFDSSRDRGEPFSFPLGAGQVIKGWDEGVAGMKVGGQRQLQEFPRNLDMVRREQVA